MIDDIHHVLKKIGPRFGIAAAIAERFARVNRKGYAVHGVIKLSI